MKEKIISVCTELKDVIDGIGAVQTAWGLIVACALIIAFVFCVFTFTNRVNKSTKAQVQRFQREGKERLIILAFHWFFLKVTILLRLKLIIYFIVWKMTVVITGKSFGSYWETNTLGLSPISIWLSMYCSVVRMMNSLQEAWESESFAKFKEKQTKVCANCTTGICRSCGLELGLNLCGNIKGNLQ